MREAQNPNQQMSQRATINTRCSRLPLTMVCPASAIKPSVVVEAKYSDLADLGSAIHEVADLAIHRKTGIHEHDIDAAAKDWRVDPDEVRIGSHWAWACYREYADYFPNPKTKKRFVFTDEDAGIELSGEPDVYDYHEQEQLVVVGDFKSGYLDTDCTDQMLGYAFLLLEEFKQAKRVYVIVWRTRDQIAYRHLFTRDDVWLWYLELMSALNKPETYNPGRHCGYCPRAHECEAMTVHLQRSIEALMAQGGIRLPADTKELGTILGALYERAKLVKRVAEKAIDLVRAEVEHAGGSLVTDDGQHLEIVEEETEPIASFTKASDILFDVVPEDRIDDVVSVSRTSLSEVIGEPLPRGRKKKGIDDVINRLRQAGAMGRGKRRKLQLNRIQKRIIRQQSEASS